MAIIQDLFPESNGAERFSYLTFSRINAIIFWLMQHASVAQSVVHLTRNEKVACSSHVTSSKKGHPTGVALFGAKRGMIESACASKSNPICIYRIAIYGNKVVQ